jgi:dTDP-4-amino-4,6-dideoxygalactose transaminase
MFRKSIFTAASPNTQFADAITAKLLLFSPWNWYNKKYDHEFVSNISSYLGIGNIHLIDSGRSALQIILRAYGISEGDKVVLPSFTCVVVANSVKYSGAIPIYLDTREEDFNASYESLGEILDEKTKAIVVQHTFGKRVEIEPIRQLLKANNREDIVIIEDFAHVIQRDLRLEGDVGFTTFGIEKVMSTVRGGAVLTNDDDVSLKIKNEIEKLPNFPRIQLIKSLLNPLFWWIAIPLHSVGFGRFTIGALIRIIWRKLGFLGIMVEGKENKAIKPDWFPAKMAPALSKLGLVQLKKLDYYNEHRKKIAEIYHNYLSEYSDSDKFDPNRLYLRYPIVFSSRKQYLDIWNLSRSLRVTLGNWFASPLYGSEVDSNTYEELCYVPETTPVTMTKCGLTLNLPTSINISEKRALELAVKIKQKLTA